MSKQIKKYCIIGKLICDLVAGFLFVAIPMLACNLAGYIATLF